MKTIAFNRISVALACVAFVFVLVSSLLFWKYSVLRIKVAFAEKQTEIFEGMRSRALQSTTPVNIASSLSYAVSYYPSYSKQNSGSSLDQIVERHRSAVLREIIAHLRRTTGEDLGDNPEPWLKKYAQR